MIATAVPRWRSHATAALLERFGLERLDPRFGRLGHLGCTCSCDGSSAVQVSMKIALRIEAAFLALLCACSTADVQNPTVPDGLR